VDYVEVDDESVHSCEGIVMNLQSPYDQNFLDQMITINCYCHSVC
jgi:hypothetical protein